jgi:hypothetical protein
VRVSPIFALFYRTTDRRATCFAERIRYIRGTTTSTGLTVQAFLDEGVYRKGLKVSRDDMKLLNVKQHEVCPQWNYTISPRNPAASEPGCAESLDGYRGEPGPSC